ncbi:MAG: mechanosensitive ion channel [Gammaproteobacteria bacterium]|nr:mechanosensitive ion channel [Gammaproteobacteria bacterium]
MEELVQGQAQLGELAQTGMTMVMAYAPKVLLAIVTLLVGLWLINKATGLLDKQLSAKDPTLGKFLHSLISIILKALLIISVASMIGIETTSFIAVLGAAGLAIGLALQGSLGNFAGGVLILLFKPYRVGDFIEAQGYMGVVKEIQIFNTILTTGDNRRVIIPNGALSNGSLINYSAEPTRRVDMTFGIGYGDDISKAKAILHRLVAQDVRILKSPEPTIAVAALADSSVNIVCRVWVNAADYWGVFFDMHETVKNTFDAEGVSIPFPQREVHIHQAG